MISKHYCAKRHRFAQIQTIRRHLQMDDAEIAADGKPLVAIGAATSHFIAYMRPPSQGTHPTPRYQGDHDQRNRTDRPVDPG